MLPTIKSWCATAKATKIVSPCCRSMSKLPYSSICWTSNPSTPRISKQAVEVGPSRTRSSAKTPTPLTSGCGKRSFLRRDCRAPLVPAASCGTIGTNWSWGMTSALSRHASDIATSVRDDRPPCAQSGRRGVMSPADLLGGSHGAGERFPRPFVRLR